MRLKFYYLKINILLALTNKNSQISMPAAKKLLMIFLFQEMNFIFYITQHGPADIFKKIFPSTHQEHDLFFPR